MLDMNLTGVGWIPKNNILITCSQCVQRLFRALITASD